MASTVDVAALCEAIRKDYSPCDVSDALLVLNVPGAGYLADINPIPSRATGTKRLVAPISTVSFVDKTHKPGDKLEVSIISPKSNLPNDKHWTDVAPPGSVVLMQQPSTQIVAVLGDIVATRYKIRGIQGVFIDGRARDNVGCGALDSLQVWSKSLTSVGTSLQAKPWAVDVPIEIGNVLISPGDILVADEAEQVCCVIPLVILEEVVSMLPRLKKADDGVLRDVQGGVDLGTAFGNWPEHYTRQH